MSLPPRADRIRDPNGRGKRYDFSQAERKAPSYGRVVAGLSTADLEADLAAGRGDAGYQAAARAELEGRRG